MHEKIQEYLEAITIARNFITWDIVKLEDDRKEPEIRVPGFLGITLSLQWAKNPSAQHLFIVAIAKQLVKVLESREFREKVFKALIEEAEARGEHTFQKMTKEAAEILADSKRLRTLVAEMETNQEQPKKEEKEAQ